ncbi:hypothetical protein FGB62_113g11 [Gracilaria domingensis]|nr:hypothetical protein FGB62_113g11 [Gracilaria domingensis]
MNRLSISPRRPVWSRPHHQAALVICATTPTPETLTLKQQLEAILDALPTFLDTATGRVEKAVASIPDQVKYLFSDEGPLGVLNFWRENKENISTTGQQLLESGELLVKGDTDAFREKASGINLSWLRPLRQRSRPSETADDNITITHQVRNTLLFLIDSLTPWDFDRHDFGLTFVTIWNDANALKEGDVNRAVLKMTSTIKPIEQEWKLSARTKLFDLGENAVVFGKAGLYLAGNRPAYIGAEADRVWPIPKLPGTKLFANVNYRSSRKPQDDPVKLTCGIEQEFAVAKGIDLTLRLAFNLMENMDMRIYPVPSGSYF